MYKLEKVGEIGFGNDLHSIYKNQNLILANEIKEFVKNSQLDKNKLLISLNLKFDASKHFKSDFGIFYKKSKNSLQILDLVERHNFFGSGADSNYTRPSVHFNFAEFSITNRNDEMLLNLSIGGKLICLYFDENGNYVNRDYNINLDEFSQVVTQPLVILEKFKKILKTKFGNSFEFFKNIFYTSDYCIIPCVNSDSFGFAIKNNRVGRNDYQNYKGDTIYKKPAKTECKNFEDLWEYLLNILPENFKTSMQF